MSGLRWVVDQADAGARLDKYLAHADRLVSRSRATGALDRGKVFLNDAEVGIDDAGRRLAVGDAVRVWMDRPGSSRPRGRERAIGNDLRVVFEDDHLMVVDKPAGLLTVPLERRPDEASALQQIAGDLKARRKSRPFVVHRIDRDTSGLIVFAMHARARERLREQFMAHTAERVYLAVVHGRPSPPAGVWQDRVMWDDRALIQKVAHATDARGKDAESRYQIVEAMPRASLLEVRLVTGKRNQIRLQAALRGCPLVGEQRYTDDDHEGTVVFPRQALHAWRLGFLHPESGIAVQFEAPMPRDMQDLLARLRRA